MAYELQRLLDGTMEPLLQLSAREQLEQFEGLGLSPTELSGMSRALGPVGWAFCNMAADEDTPRGVQQLLIEKYELSLQSNETFARVSRIMRNGTSQDEKKGKRRKPLNDTPAWYNLYLASDYWQKIKHKAYDYYGGCVACGSIEKPNCHHRHYRTLGNEGLRDLSVFCELHHGRIHQVIGGGLFVPRECPVAVSAILGAEGRM